MSAQMLQNMDINLNVDPSKMFQPLVDIGLPSFCVMMLIGIILFVFKLFFGKFASPFYTLYISLIMADCLSYIMSYLRQRLPLYHISDQWYKDNATGIFPRLFEFLFYHSQIAQCFALFMLIIYQTSTMLRMNNGMKFQKRKTWPLVLTVIAVLFTWIIPILISARLFASPIYWKTTYGISLTYPSMVDEAMNWGIVGILAFVTAFVGIILLLIALICLRARSYEAGEFRRWAMLCFYVMFQWLLTWYYVILVYIGLLSLKPNVDKLSLLGWLTLQKHNFGWVIDFCTVNKHWLFLLLNHDFIKTIWSIGDHTNKQNNTQVVTVAPMNNNYGNEMRSYGNGMKPYGNGMRSYRK